MEMETTQIKGVDSTIRDTKAHLDRRRDARHQGKDHDPRSCSTRRRTSPSTLNGDESQHERHLALGGQGSTPTRCSTPTSAATTSAPATRSATPSSWTTASSARVPEITANSVDASLIHEAAIGKIAGEQLIKLHDPRPDREGGRGADHQRLPEVRCAA